MALCLDSLAQCRNGIHFCSNVLIFLNLEKFRHVLTKCICIIPGGILGQWDILLLNLTFIGLTSFFKCLIFDLFFFTNTDVVTIKDETFEENSRNECRSN